MKKGFSLIEIMVVIVILGILAAVGVPKVTNQIENAKIAADTQVLNALHKAIALASMEDNFHSFFIGTDNKQNVKVMRVRVSWSVANQNGAGNEFQKLIVTELKANAGKDFIELTSEKTASGGNVAAIYKSNLIKKKKLDIMILIMDNDNHFKICALATDSGGRDGTIKVYTYRGKPVAVGDVPGKKDSWNGVTFNYIPLED